MSIYVFYCTLILWILLLEMLWCGVAKTCVDPGITSNHFVKTNPNREIKQMSLRGNLNFTLSSLSVVTHQQVCVFQVLFPEGPDLPLSSNVPNIEFHAMRGDTLYVEALK